MMVMNGILSASPGAWNVPQMAAASWGHFHDVSEREIFLCFSRDSQNLSLSLLSSPYLSLSPTNPLFHLSPMECGWKISAKMLHLALGYHL